MKKTILTVIYNPGSEVLTICNRTMQGGAVRGEKQYDKIRTPGEVGTAVKDYMMGLEEKER